MGNKYPQSMPKSGNCIFFQTMSGVNKKKAGRELEGRTWNGMPVRQIAFG
jgi:protein gp37